MTRNTSLGHHQRKLVFFMVGIIFVIIFFFSFTFLFLFLVFIFYKGGFRFGKILKFFGITKSLEEVFGKRNYEKLIKNNRFQKYKGKKSSRKSIENFYQKKREEYIKQSSNNVENIIHKNRGEEIEQEKNKIREKNKNTLKEKLYQKKVVAKYSKNIYTKSDIISYKHGNNIGENIKEEKHKFTSNFAKKTSHIILNKNYFGNTK